MCKRIVNIALVFTVFSSGLAFLWDTRVMATETPATVQDSVRNSLIGTWEYVSSVNRYEIGELPADNAAGTLTLVEYYANGTGRAEYVFPAWSRIPPTWMTAPDRMSLWADCLRIADKLEQEGALPECVEETRIAGGYSFRCRIYRTEKLGSICIPGLPGEKVDGEDAVGGLAYDADSYNALVSNRRARVIIKQFTDMADG